MELEKIPTVPTADELLDRSFRRAAARMREKRGSPKKRGSRKGSAHANEEFIRAVGASLHDRLVRIISSFPEFDALPPFYRNLTEALCGIEKIRMSLGALGWAAKQSRRLGSQLGREARASGDSPAIRKRAVARLSSVVHQVDDDLRFLNIVRNQLRELPELSEEFTVVVAGYPNVGKSSFIRLVSTAEPEVASYPFTTRGIFIGHRAIGRDRVQFVDTPGLLDRDPEERNPIERQALSALMHAAHVVLFILDPSEECGYPVESQRRLLDAVKGMVEVPVIAAVNKADRRREEGFLNMSSTTGDGVDAVLEAVFRTRAARPTAR
ncbi:MAG: 50S ribosome-binding GTPase [Methanomicrobiales archaeon]|nr:small GTP-binding protein [Methanomicrobia archaeon]MDD1638840.1 50S ribosome-binding GTPase [Methanomicrobiales archaeon]MDD1646092.1 50S ribosome-binding GTPase [Methanomicrobiales archaeon]